MKSLIMSFSIKISKLVNREILLSKLNKQSNTPPLMYINVYEKNACSNTAAFCGRAGHNCLQDIRI